ncbi:tetratricopeptide repeat protein [Desulfovibrio sp. OttesenSCG-928-F07]|nr:tetratricopeptide repeat protein [Desulfovibrio sp. OttesenSCG-928-F07]
MVVTRQHIFKIVAVCIFLSVLGVTAYIQTNPSRQQQTLVKAIDASDIYYKSKEYAKAEKLLDDSIRTSIEVLGKTNADIIEAKLRLGAIYLDTGEEQKCLLLIEDLISDIQMADKTNSVEFANACGLAANALCRLGKIDNSVEYAVVFLKGYMEHNEHIDLVLPFFQLTINTAMAGEPQKTALLFKILAGIYSFYLNNGDTGLFNLDIIGISEELQLLNVDVNPDLIKILLEQPNTDNVTPFNKAITITSGIEQELYKEYAMLVDQYADSNIDESLKLTVRKNFDEWIKNLNKLKP